ncbi:MAG: DUF4132 domain-containing protein [Bacteroidota bacterium]
MNILSLFDHWQTQPLDTSYPFPSGYPTLQVLTEDLLSYKKEHGLWEMPKLGSLESYAAIKKLSIAEKKELIIWMTLEMDREILFSRTNSGRRHQQSREVMADKIYQVLLPILLKSNLQFLPEELYKVFTYYRSFQSAHNYPNLSYRPMGLWTQQMEKSIKKQGWSSSWETFLTNFLGWHELAGNHTYGADLDRVKAKLRNMLHKGQHPEAPVPPFSFFQDRVSHQIEADHKQFAPKVQDAWTNLFHLFLKATSGKPSQRYLKSLLPYIEAIESDTYQLQVQEWLRVYLKMEAEQNVHYYQSGGTYTYYSFLHDKIKVFLKGMIWSLLHTQNSEVLTLLAQVTQKSFEKVPGVGPKAASIGNAAIYVLAQSEDLEGISHLSRLRMTISQNNTQKLINKYIEAASEARGISPQEIEEMSIPDFGLKEGEKDWHFEEYRLNVKIVGIGKISQTWYKPDGKIQKSVPAFVKNTEEHAHRLKKAKAEVKQIQKYVTAQRDRIDRSYLHNRSWSYEAFQKYYLHHGLISFISKRLLWRVEVEAIWQDVYWHTDNWKTLDGQTIDVSSATSIRQWHPLDCTTDNLLRWRSLFDRLQIKQPLKQVYREIYLLTDAEVNTRIYSNRMAAHLLKQHQFNTLAARRGWRYSLLGAYDDGRDGEIASIEIPAFQLEAQYWINEVAADDAFNDTGIWDYIATDQVRFEPIGQQEALPLIDIPKIVFSEIMRDVDMFVGVCSVGNDPEWQDNGGLPQYRDYWASYSFGDLSEVARTRKQILENIVPRLKIRDVASIDGKFLKVQGKIRTYKIHIGSTNILMEPNDQYLCIVPSRKKDQKVESVFLPFEGDRGLSVVLSKAFLLAEDDKISDPTITSQIKRSRA